MKILYDCFSCSPYYGSDEGIGWLWPYHMRKYHEVWALVREDRRADIEKYCKEYHIDDIHFIYADIPESLNFYYKNKAKGKNGTLDFLAYQFLWQYPAYRVAKQVHKQVHFDLVHHVSTNDFRFLGQLYRLGIPYFIGPIGGAQETPQALQYYVRNHKKSEKLRTLLNYTMTHFPGYGKALACAQKVYFSNQETKNFLLPRIKDHTKCEIMTEVGYSIDKMNEITTKKVNELKKTTFIWAGRMEYRKGLELLFDSVDLLPMEQEWEIVLCGEGSQEKYYRSIVAQKQYCNRIIFTGKLCYEEMQEVYNTADVFVFPSLRETTGTVIIEAMAHGVPVIALKQGGAAEVITQETGYCVNGTTKEEYVENFAAAMTRCMDNPLERNKKGQAAQKRIIDCYTWEAKIRKMNDVYSQMVN